jgi:hypothetical protein
MVHAFFGMSLVIELMPFLRFIEQIGKLVMFLLMALELV